MTVPVSVEQTGLFSRLVGVLFGATGRCLDVEADGLRRGGERP